MRTLYNALAAGSLVALVFLALAWELALAPLRPGGSWLALKALPLLLPLRGVLAGRRYTYRWALVLVLAYFAEGVVRAWAEAPPAAHLALIQTVLALIFFASAIGYLRVTSAAISRVSA
jgi:uncharacterized membrane protein